MKQDEFSTTNQLWNAGATEVQQLNSHSLNIFSSETTRQIKVKFHMELLWDRRTKVYTNGPGHMTKMVAIPIYGKSL